MADRMCVTSLTGITSRREYPGERPYPTPRGGSGIFDLRARLIWRAARSRSVPWEWPMSILPAALFDFDFFEPLPIQIEVSDAPLTSDAGLLPLRPFDARIGLTQQFAAVLDDPRHPDLIEHSYTEMVRRRVFGIL